MMMTTTKKTLEWDMYATEFAAQSWSVTSDVDGDDDAVDMQPVDLKS